MTALEKKALLTITGLLIVSYLVQWIRPHVIRTEMYDYSMEDSLFRITAADTQSNIVPESVAAPEEAGRQLTTAQKKAPINLNTAGVEELESLPRIGISTARLIIDYRTQHGGFRTVDELKRVPRIGVKTLEILRPLVCVGEDSL